MPNFFDLLIMVLFSGIVLLSFLGGIGKVFSTLVGLYGGTVVAAWFYQPLSELMLARMFTHMNRFIGNLTAFLLLLFLGSMVITIGLGRNHFLQQFARRIGLLNNLTGGVLGIVIAIFAAILSTMVTSLLLQVLNATAALGSSPALAQVQWQLMNSTLVPLFLKLAPVLIMPLRLFMPQGLPPLLVSGGL